MVMSWSSRQKKEGNFCTVLVVRTKFFYHLCFISMHSVFNTLSEYTCIYISKNITSYTFLLVSKIVQTTSVSLIVLRKYRLFYFKYDKFIFPLKNNVTGNFNFRCNVQRKWLHILYFSISKLSGALKAFPFKPLKII